MPIARATADGLPVRNARRPASVVYKRKRAVGIIALVARADRRSRFNRNPGVILRQDSGGSLLVDIFRTRKNFRLRPAIGQSVGQSRSCNCRKPVGIQREEPNPALAVRTANISATFISGNREIHGTVGNPGLTQTRHDKRNQPNPGGAIKYVELEIPRQKPPDRIGRVPPMLEGELLPALKHTRHYGVGRKLTDEVNRLVRHCHC